MVTEYFIKIEFIKYMDLNRKEIPYILFLLVFTTIITIIMINFNNQIGVYCSDVYVYLLNSLNFAGIDLGSHSPLYLSPVICFCTSLLFRLGYVTVNARAEMSAPQPLSAFVSRAAAARSGYRAAAPSIRRGRSSSPRRPRPIRR